MALSQARARIMASASQLFSQYGYQAVGVDTLVAEANVAKATLYKHFPSKDDVIVAYLHQEDENLWHWWEEAVEDATTPRERLLAVFNMVEKRVTSPTCYGCPFLLAAAEFPKQDHPAHRFAVEHKKKVQQRLFSLISAAGFDNPDQLTDALYLIYDGAWMSARLFGPQNPAEQLSAQVERVIGSG